MKSLWVQTLAWIAAILIAVLLAFASPDAQLPQGGDAGVPQGSSAPR